MEDQCNKVRQHYELNHKDKINAELRKEKSAAARTENLYRRGARHIDVSRIVGHVKKFNSKAKLPPRRVNQLMVLIRRCLAEGLVFVGDELDLGRRVASSRKEYKIL